MHINSLSTKGTICHFFPLLMINHPTASEKGRYQWRGGKSAPEQYLEEEITFKSNPTSET